MGFVWGAAALGFEICWAFGEFRSLLLPVCLESLNCRIFAQLCVLGAKTHRFTVFLMFLPPLWICYLNRSMSRWKPRAISICKAPADFSIFLLKLYINVIFVIYCDVDLKKPWALVSSPSPVVSLKDLFLAWFDFLYTHSHWDPLLESS